MNIPMPSTDSSLRHSGHSRLDEASALDLYLGRIHQNLAALGEQCAQLRTAFAKRQESVRDIHELQRHLGAGSSTIAELRKAVDQVLPIAASGPAAGAAS
jgi:hypothetical protein